MDREEIQKRIEEWTSSKYDRATRAEIQGLLDRGAKAELVDRFYQDLNFGTGGMRGVLGAGTNRMNLYTVEKVAEGLSEHLKKRSFDGQKTVVIGYDSRHGSKEFAIRFAEVLAFDEIKSYLFESIQPTPLLSYAIRELKTLSGVMITASHNPREYNGIKIYGPDGGQVLPPLETEVIDSIQRVRKVYRVSKTEAEKKGLIQYTPGTVEESYYQNILNLRLNARAISENPIRVVFTPLHGTGNIPVKKILYRSGLKDLWVVREQEDPDPDFPSVEYPNPEEEGTLDLALSLGSEKNADLVLATDPDADRLAIAVPDKNQEWVRLTGNQLGTLLCHYILEQSKKQNLLNKNSLVIKSIVSTDLIFDIAERFGVHVEEVLTGFKYIAEKLKIYHDEEKKVHREYVFGFEESCGYGIGEVTRDKDAVSASLLVVEMACFCKSKGISLLDYLEEIYREYGYSEEELESMTLEGKKGKETIENLLESFRLDPPKEIGNSLVERIRDIQKGEMLYCLENRVETLNFPRSNVLTYYLENGSKVTLRPSGTEPKIKFYLSVGQKRREEKDSSRMRKELLDLLKELKSAWRKEIEKRK